MPGQRFPCAFCGKLLSKKARKSHENQCGQSDKSRLPIENSPKKKFVRVDSSSCNTTDIGIVCDGEAKTLQTDFASMTNRAVMFDDTSLCTSSNSAIENIDYSSGNETETDQSEMSGAENSDAHTGTQFGQLFQAQHDRKELKKKLLEWGQLLSFLLVFWQLLNFVSNRALDGLLFALNELLSALSAAFEDNPVLSNIPTCFKRSTYRLFSAVNCQPDIVKLVVCPKCESVCELNQLTNTDGSLQLTCPSLSNGPIRGVKKCGEVLFRKLRVKNVNSAHHPKYVYSCASLQNAITKLVQRDDFLAYFDVTSYAQRVPNHYTDIKDGCVWKKFAQMVHGSGTLFAGMIMNMDWFQPFERSQLSVGVIFFACANLPRALRYQRENVIVGAVIPWIKREPKNLNPFLKPIVDELLILCIIILYYLAYLSLALQS